MCKYPPNWFVRKFTFKCFVDNVHLRGIKKSNEKYLRSFIRDIFKSTNFNEIVLNSEELRSALYDTGCFKQINVVIDVPKSKISIKSLINLD